MAAVELNRAAKLLRELMTRKYGDPNVQRAESKDTHEIMHATLGKPQSFRSKSTQIGEAIQTSAIVRHKEFGRIFAYEIDGFGSHLLMDDANVPNLLSLPYLGFCSPTDPVYQNTRKFILSPNNPYFHSGQAGSGVGGPHIGLGWIWPLGIITQAITSTEDAEILACLKTLKTSSVGTGFIHEAFWMNDPARFTRHWFAWANTFFGELVLHLAQTRPHLLRQPLA